MLLVMALSASFGGSDIGLSSYTPNPPAELRDDSTEYVILRFSGKIYPDQKAALEALGVELYDYVPTNAFIARAPLNTRDAIRATGFITDIIPFHPAYRLQPGTGQKDHAIPRYDKDLYLLVTLFPGVKAGDFTSRFLRMGAEVLYESQGPETEFRLRLPRYKSDAIYNIARMEGVRWVQEEPDAFFMNNNTRWSVQTHIQGDSLVWRHGIHGEGEVIGLMDSGLDYFHCFFRDDANPIGPTHRKVPFYYCYNSAGDTFASCTQDHGTHVAGTAAGEDIFDGNQQYNGMAYKAKIGCGDVQADDSWSCTWGALDINSDLYTIYTDFHNASARLMTNSWGSSATDYDTYARDVDRFMHDNPYDLVMFAAGNSGPGYGTVGTPGCAKNCVTVGATAPFPNDNAIAGYSSRGPAYDGRIKPTLTAPGGDSNNGGYINSADNNPNMQPTCNIQGNPFQGTSMATPAVTGSAALVRQYYEEGWYPSGAPVPSDAFTPQGSLVKATLIASAVPMTGVSTDPIDSTQGFGRVLLDEALYFGGDENIAKQMFVVDETLGLNQGQQDVYTVSVADASQGFKAVLVWTDYPAATGANPALVNDLDLEVYTPGGTLYRGNNIVNYESQPGGTADNLNVEEMVVTSTAETGDYSVVIKGTNVPQGPQPYSLVVLAGLSTVSAPEHGGVPGKAFLRVPGLMMHEKELVFGIPHESRVKLVLYDATGRAVSVLRDETLGAGTYDVALNPALYPAGVYFLRLSTGEGDLSAKTVFMK